MWGLGGISTVLLAASTTRISPTTQRSSSSLSSTKSMQELTNNFRELYDILGGRAPIYYQPTSCPKTIRFSFVTPPPSGQTWLDDSILYGDLDLLTTTTTTTKTIEESISDNDTDDDSIFQLVAKKHGDEKPILLYLPGLDGFGVSAATWQFDDLARTFEFWRMSIKIQDRTSFGNLLKTVTDFIEQLSNANPKRPFFLMGESFGGLLTPCVALKLQEKYKRLDGIGNRNPLNGMILVNPATSFDQTNWDSLAPLLTTFGDLTDRNPMPFGLPTPYSIAGGLILSSLIPSSEQNQRMLTTLLSLESLQKPAGAAELLESMVGSFKLTSDVLPAGLLKHRISNWMIVGSSLLNPRLSDLQLPTLVVTGTEDKLIPSGTESRRLTKTLPNCETLEVRGAGHFVLDENVNLTEAIIYSKRLDPLNFNETKMAYDPIMDWKMPSKEVIERVREENVNKLTEAFSPIFISTGKDGNRAFGLQNLPKEDNPLLFVSNHQLLGLDLNLVISGFIENDLAVRGLAHPVVFQTPNNGQRMDLGGRIPGLKNRNGADGSRNGGFSTRNFELFGAVKVTPRNFYRLLQTGQNVLLFPGGVKEVFHGREEAYELLWPEKVDFVRTAARFNATIIPLNAVGMADSLNILLDRDEVLSLPILGERARKFATNTTAARFDMSNEEEIFLPPIVAPGLPSRNYFLFGKPIPTTDLDPSDKEACQRLYMDIQKEMKRGFEAVLTAREKDPYKDAPQRISYEQFRGTKAPTFSLDQLEEILANP